MVGGLWPTARPCTRRGCTGRLGKAPLVRKKTPNRIADHVKPKLARVGGVARDVVGLGDSSGAHDVQHELPSTLGDADGRETHLASLACVNGWDYDFHGEDGVE